MGKGWKNPAKAETAQKKGKIFTKLAREISVATKLGGSDPDSNSRLKMAINAAKAASCPKDTIERAIKRGSGELNDSSQFEELLYEGYAPHNVGVIIQSQTDNKNRTITDLRTLFKKKGGSLGESGSVQWMFERVGAIEASKDGNYDPEEVAIDIEANEVDAGDDPHSFIFYTDLTTLDDVHKKLQEKQWQINSSGPAYKAKTPSELTEEQIKEVYSFLEAIEDLDDTQFVYATL